MKTNTKNTKTATKTVKTVAKPSAVKSVKTAKGHTLAAVKDGKLVKIAECVREDATAAKPKSEAVKAKPKQQKTPEASKPSETFAAMIERHFKERQEIAPRSSKPFNGAVATPSGFVARDKIAAAVALANRHFNELHAFMSKHYEAAFEWALKLFDGDPRAALFYLVIPFHDDRGDGKLHVPMFHRRPMMEAWQRVASAGGYKLAAEMVAA